MIALQGFWSHIVGFEVKSLQKGGLDEALAVSLSCQGSQKVASLFLAKAADMLLDRVYKQRCDLVILL